MKKILIIGATSSIAQETAKLFAHAGDAMFLAARSEERLRIVADDLKARGAAQVGYEAHDANDTASHEVLVIRASEAIGGLDIVLIAYGILGDQKLYETSFAETEKVIHTNFTSVVSFLTILANRFEAQRHGTIAVISSVAGDRVRQSNYVYGSTKAALSGFLEGLRGRLHPAGVTVLTIKPGFVDTPMTATLPKNFLFARPENIAKGIFNAIQAKRDVVYLPWFWKWIMLAVKMVPGSIFKKIRI